jgi:hypothetical protein
LKQQNVPNYVDHPANMPEMMQIRETPAKTPEAIQNDAHISDMIDVPFSICVEREPTPPHRRNQEET